MQTSNFNIKLQQIDLIAIDFDGVLTDNKVLTFQDDQKYKMPQELQEHFWLTFTP